MAQEKIVIFHHDERGAVRTWSEVGELVRCKDCRWGRETYGNIECFVDSNIPPEYHGYDWFCPNGERRTDE